MTDGAPVRLRRVAIGVDFAEPSLAAVSCMARHLAPGAQLLLVHAVDTEVPASLGARRPRMKEEELTSEMELATERLHALAEDHPDRTVNIRVASDRPAWVIAAAAESWGADLIVVGPHSGRDTAWERLGSTAERLVRMSPVPILMMTVPPASAPYRILVPVDRVELTHSVLQWASSLADASGAEVTLLHVTEPEDTEDERRTAREWLSALAKELPATVRRDVMLESGSPGETVLAVARRIGADFVVMGRRGRGRALPAVIGSTVSDVLRTSVCPVLVVVDPKDAILDSWDSEQ